MYRDVGLLEESCSISTSRFLCSFSVRLLPLATLVLIFISPPHSLHVPRLLQIGSLRVPSMLPACSRVFRVLPPCSRHVPAMFPHVPSTPVVAKLPKLEKHNNGNKRRGAIYVYTLKPTCPIYSISNTLLLVRMQVPWVWECVCEFFCEVFDPHAKKERDCGSRRTCCEHLDRNLNPIASYVGSL